MRKIIIILFIVVFSFASGAYAANSYTGNPIVMDATADHDGGYLIYKMEWHPAVVNDDLLLKDKEANIIWQVRAPIAAANHESYGIETKNFIPPEYIRGLYLNTIDGGTLYIYKVD